MQELTQKLISYNIIIHDRRDKQGSDTFRVRLTQHTDQEKWLEYIKRRFSNYLIPYEANTVKIYLVNQGVDVQVLIKMRAFALGTNFEHVLTNLPTAEIIEGIPVLKLAEVIALQAMANEEKKHDLHYQRLVDPDNIATAYTFKVKYNKQLRMLVPYEKNGQPVKGGMEGFSNFTSFFNFITNHAKKPKAYRHGSWIYLRHEEDTQSVIAIKTNEDRLEIISRARPLHGPHLDLHLVGEHREIQSAGKIYHPEGVVTLVDSIVLK
jgi:hypothetical protein